MIMWKDSDKPNITSWKKARLNYWGIPKCGNTSIKYTLMMLDKNARLELINSDRPELVAHSPSLVSYITMEEALSNGYTNFTVVRHPYERFISAVNYIIKDRRIDTIYDMPSHITNIDTLLDFIEDTPDESRDIHIRSQFSFISDSQERILVDKIFKLENIREIEQFIGSRVFHSNKSSGARKLSREQKKRIWCIYNKDFTELNYEKN
jgi:hypothetical protein